MPRKGGDGRECEGQGQALETCRQILPDRTDCWLALCIAGAVLDTLAQVRHLTESPMVSLVLNWSDMNWTSRRG